MIDIHTHLLPNIDDGPRDMKEALALLEQGARDGIRGAVCTSHVLNKLDEKIEQQHIQAFQELKAQAKRAGIEMSLWLGSEIHCQSIFNYKSRLATINGNGKYLLFELPLGDFPSDTNDRIFKLSLENVILILAHPERNLHILKHPETAFELVNRGVLMQMNAGSITGQFGKQVMKTAVKLLDHRLVHFVGSDCHGAVSRPMILSEAYRVVRKRWGKETADNLFDNHAVKAIKGEPIQIAPPISFQRKKSRWRFF